MNNFVILARKRWGDACIPLTQIKGGEGHAVEVAQRIHKDGGMNRTLVLDDTFKIVFKQDRICRCLNCQYTINGELVCEDCKRVIPANGMEVEAYQ